MARKTVGYIHLEWECPNCLSRNPGPSKFCMGCGAPQPEDVEFQQPDAAALVTDEEEIARAKAGPDVHCPYCEARNPGNAKFCGSCGGDLSEAAVRKHGKVLGARKKDAQPIVCPACGTENKAGAKRCVQCGSTLTKPKSKVKPAPIKQRSLALMIALAVVACIAISVVGYLLLSTNELAGEVTAVSWERSVGIEELLPTTKSDWYEDIPAGVMIESCTQELYETRNDYVPGSVEVCGTEYVEDTGTGLGEVVQDCVYEVYADWCDYTVDDWQEVDRVTASGTDLNPYWPNVTLTMDQRRGTETESFEVTFTTSKKDYTYNPETISEFTGFRLGSEWILEVNKLGGLVSVEPD